MMKKFLSIALLFLLTQQTFALAWVCYPPHDGNGNGPNCFGSRGNCSDFTTCTCQCWGDPILPFPHPGTGDGVVKVNGEGVTTVTVGGVTTTVCNVANYATLSQLFVFSYVPELSTVVLKVYNRNGSDLPVLFKTTKFRI